MQNALALGWYVQLQRRDAYHERCRVVRLHVLEELALQLRARKGFAAIGKKSPGAFDAPEALMPR
jgi:hypothetical protein